MNKKNRRNLQNNLNDVFLYKNKYCYGWKGSNGTKEEEKSLLLQFYDTSSY